MDISKQVCSLEQAKRLQDLGVNYENSPYTWMYAVLSNDGDKFEDVPMLFRDNTGEYDKWPAMPFGDKWNDATEEDYETKGNYPAFTVAELGVMLPENAGTGNYAQDELMMRYCNETSVERLPDIDAFFRLLTDPKFLAALLIHLLENNHITAEEVNQRLKAA